MTTFDFLILLMYARLLWETVSPSDGVLYLFNLWTLGVESVLERLKR